ncbi:MAG: rhomboid family intramembrane serine protease [Pirellulales bacterium]
MIPVSTDAPIYHWPVATVVTIVINLIFFLLFCLNADSDVVSVTTPDGRVLTIDQLEIELEQFETEEAVEKFVKSLRPNRTGLRNALSLEFGTFKPWQWLTNNFMHAGWGHIVGNMIFLWAFGLIVEGKVGWLVFTAIYLGMGTIYGFLLQTLSLPFGWPGSALGASAAIFGLLAFCIAWAPANEFTILFRFTTIEISILVYGALFVGKEVLFWWMSGFEMSSELLHILGFAVGMPIALWMVKAGKVDCEGWDLFSYLSGNTGEHSAIGQARESENRQKSIAQRKAEAANAKARALEVQAERVETNNRLQDQVRQAIDQGEFELAIRIQARLTQTDPMILWRQRDLYAVIQHMLRSKEYDRALPLIEKHIELFEESRFTMQVAMMKIWLAQKQARKTIEYLQGFNPSFMTPEEVQQVKQLASAAKKQLASNA